MDTAAASTMDKAGWLAFDTGTNRWPRQETLSLLEIRSRLDSKFRENNQKAPLWNEISRIMAEEFGYQRSGKKCKEKFENLYKYYKKTKEGKASRQDGKHYRFFRQLEAICGSGGGGDSSNTTTHNLHHASASNTTASASVAGAATTVQTPRSFNGDHHHHNNLIKCSESLSFSNSCELETSSSENNNDEDLSAIAYMMKHSSSNKQKGVVQLDDDHDDHGGGGRVRRRRSLRAKVEEIVGSHMRKIMETQDAWMERMISVVEQREKEMASMEEERKKKESMRFDQEVSELWAKERAWVEARDAALIQVVRKHIENNGNNNNKEEFEIIEALAPQCNNKNNKGQSANNNNGRWSEMEISSLIQLRTGFEERMRENNNNNNNYYFESNNWEEISGKLGCLGFERSSDECKQLWDEISISLGRTNTTTTSSAVAKNNRPWCLGLKLSDDDDDHDHHGN
ncbi:hypothetical protein PIB30_012658 [Stylosanthes scabra]|uniref:Myb-like domain-containing protein n=1 Tax=Stylosanthes scabra TaxID=79078 RepID=A0ABU6Z5Q9_9FABA|nr:hypothetical protein [Stylosanthes scabra]